MNTVGDLYAELNNLESRLLNSIRTLSREQVVPFLESEIGYQKDDIGNKLRFKITHLFDTAFNQSSTIMNGISASIERQLDISSEFADSITNSAFSASTKALNAVSKIPVDTIKNGVFAARDILKSVTGFAYKFKPWEATKLAGNISKWAGPIGAGIQVLSDIISVAQQQRAENEFKSLQNDLAELVKNHFVEPLKMLEDKDNVLATFAPQIKAFEKILADQQANVASLQQRHEQLEKLKTHLNQAFSDGQVFEGEFRAV